MKIGLLVPTLERGGTERQVSLLALALCRRGHSVTVITFRPGGELERDLENTGVVLRSLAGGVFEPASYLVGLTSWIVAEAPDALYSFLPPSNVMALIAGFLGRKCRICWGVRSANMPLQGYGLKTRLAYKLERALSGLPDCIIVNSQAGLAACLQQGYPAQRMRMIANGFDTDLFRPDPDARMRLRAEFGIKPEQVLIGIPARLDPVKDHHTFLAAASILKSQHDDARFICIGGGPPHVADRLRAATADLGLGDRIVWAGNRNDMGDVLNALDVATLCSVSEGFPNTVGEAMACGVPCVVTDVGDAAFLVGETGIVIAPRDPAALASAWDSLYSPERRSRLGQAARARMVEFFGLERLVDQTVAALAGRP